MGTKVGCQCRRIFDTVEVRSSSLLVPTIFFNHLAALASFPEAPNGSVKRAEPGRGGCSTLPRSRLPGNFASRRTRTTSAIRFPISHSGLPAIHSQSQESALTACPGVRLDADPPVSFIFRLRHGGGPYIPVCTSTSRFLVETPLGPFLSLSPVSEGIRFVHRCTRAHSR